MSLTEDALVNEYAPLVRRHALHYIARLPANVELDDLIQAGMMGLLSAIRSFRVGAGATLQTYATARIRGAMIDALREQDWLSRSVRAKGREIEEAITQLRQRLMREPTEQEIADALSLDLADYQEMLDDAGGVQIVHYEDFDRYNEDGQGEALDFLNSTNVTGNEGNPLNDVLSGELRDSVVNAIVNLPKREKQVLTLMFQEDLTQKEIALVMEISEGRVSQLRTQAITRIRASLDIEHWQGRPEEFEGQTIF